MLSRRVPPANRAWLLALLALWALLLFGGFAVGLVTANGSIPTPSRMGSSLVLVVAGWAWVVAARQTEVARYGVLIAVGMSLGFLGDLFMAGLIPVGDRMLGGMGSFGLGHVFYIAAMVGMGNRCGLASRATRWAALAAWLLIGCVGWYAIVFPTAKPPELAWGALGYCLLLASTAGIATGLALQARSLWPLALGTALFFGSDLMIAVEQFAGVKSAWIGPAIWLTYGPAQALIVYSTSSWLGLKRET